MWTDIRLVGWWDMQVFRLVRNVGEVSSALLVCIISMNRGISTIHGESWDGCSDDVGFRNDG